MVFSSILFLSVFLPVFLLLYLLVSKTYMHSTTKENMLVLFFSILFYAWGAPKFVFLLLAILYVNFYVVKWMHQSEKHAKCFFALSLFINIGLLAYFKYANFFVGNLNSFLSAIGKEPVSWVDVALPIGISFFTFQSISYTIDVYRGDNKPIGSVLNYFLYILMFPQLIAGPIIRYNSIADSLCKRESTWADRIYGIYVFSVGLAKKVLIANVLGEYVDGVFDNSISQADTLTLWLVMISYSFQIYFDFSGYSDMAIGLGRVMGFRFPENFDCPYISQSITEFWRRWHITLGNWLFNYIYKPLGGSRVDSKFRVAINLMIVFFVSGLWHGAAWNFVVWGLWHGVFIVMDKFFLNKIFTYVNKYVRIFFTYIVILIGWCMFRADNLSDALVLIIGMFAFQDGSNALLIDKQFVTTFVLASMFAFVCASNFGNRLMQMLYSEQMTSRRCVSNASVALLLMIVSISYITASGFNPFIYFRF